MTAGDEYARYLSRLGEIRGERKRLAREEFERLAEEHARLKARMDPADIQLDEWKRFEELCFLLAVDEDDEESET